MKDDEMTREETIAQIEAAVQAIMLDREASEGALARLKRKLVAIGCIIVRDEATGEYKVVEID